MFIPMAVGLLDSKGKDMPLTSVHHEGLLHLVVSNGYIERSLSLSQCISTSSLL
ncbi:hypothetical protein QJS04_geneDACA023607 [Acorus gramineus]|uniref:Uncharacterized protein n=1 Tax=Acorus gramineus TaxID=55184 RepID=A0AAV8ZXU6_ACOGR|nr:hypothetical protein QJS04_geneDACA023607 [Acorus gramineus]